MRGDIRRVPARGGAPGIVVQAPADDVVYLYPRFAPDGRLLVTRAENMQTTGEHSRLEWIAADGTGAPQPAVEDARDADVSRDGSRLAFVRYNADTTRTSLWVAGPEGENARQLVGPEVFASVQAPRFSPDGQWLAFGVHGPAQKELPTLAWRGARDGGAGTCALSLAFLCVARRADAAPAAHAAPGGLWRVNLQSGRFQDLTGVYDDSPVAAWSGDGSRIAIHDFTGLRLIDLNRQEIYPLYLEDGGSGGMDWTGE